MSLPLTPSFTGFIGSTEDAVLVIQAVLSGDFPVVDHRPQDRERVDLIKSGNVFVFIEESSGIKRWTDGISWSASRILGRFLVYRELDPSSVSEKDDKRKRRKHLDLGIPQRRTLSHDAYPPGQEPTLYQPDYRRLGQLEGYRNPFDQRAPKPLNSRPDGLQGFGQSLPPQLHAYGPPQQFGGLLPRDQQQNRQGLEDHGLIKKTISVTISNTQRLSDKEEKQTIHLISYYSAHDVLSGKLSRPSEGTLKNLTIPQLLWDAVKKLSLGGKIPIEEEAFYFLDLNYQLQNMSVLLNSRIEPPKLLTKGTSLPHQPQPLGGRTVSRSTPVSKTFPPVLPVPFSGPAPPIAFHADYIPPLFQQLSSKQASQPTSDPVKKEEGQPELGPSSSYATPNVSIPGYNPPPSTFGYNHYPQTQAEQRSPELQMQQPYGISSLANQNVQHLLYEQQTHHYPLQTFLPGPPVSQEHQFTNQDAVFVPGYPSQYTALPYQMYNNAAYFPGGGQMSQSATANFAPGAGTAAQPQQPTQFPQTEPQPHSAQQQQQPPADFNGGQRPGGYYEALGNKLTTSTSNQNSTYKRSLEYPEYFQQVEEPYNFN